MAMEPIANGVTYAQPLSARRPSVGPGMLVVAPPQSYSVAAPATDGYITPSAPLGTPRAGYPSGAVTPGRALPPQALQSAPVVVQQPPLPTSRVIVAGNSVAVPGIARPVSRVTSWVPPVRRPSMSIAAGLPTPPVPAPMPTATAVPGQLAYGHGASTPRVLSYAPPPVRTGELHTASHSVLPVAPIDPVAAMVSPEPQEPTLPPSLTAGIPDPPSIDRQKAMYARGLDDQLDQGKQVLNVQLKQQTEYLYAIGDQQKRQFALQIDRQIKQKEMELAQQHNQQLLMLQQAAQQQKSALDHQANALTMEYNQKKAHEDLLMQQYEFAKAHFETTMKYTEEMRQLQQQQDIAHQQVAAQHTQLAQQVQIASQHAQSAHMTAAQTLHSSAASAAQVAALTAYGDGSHTPRPGTMTPVRATSTVLSVGTSYQPPTSYGLPAATSYGPAHA
eukprot:TRINITY_DN71335_c0_g1_i1.p1 TRINITY_DN71335_c0_g1~~TRINITY_DN71335_c0_g1_i1.p1  ORF type:complete len:446 (+),score=78.78 TRINITY_DN71335_c0_g1_i1:69-1406(+)